MPRVTESDTLLTVAAVWGSCSAMVTFRISEPLRPASLTSYLSLPGS
jgi:hypothetical protein